MALDMGSTYTKLAILQKTGAPQVFERPSPQPVRTDGRFEVDADAYVGQVLDMMEKYAPADLEGILISTQMHGCVLSDADFRPVTPYISWQDEMGTKHMPQIRVLLEPKDVAPAGVPLKANLAMCALLGRRYFGEQLPEGAYFHTLGGYVIARLTGQHVCHVTNAAPTGMVDLQSGTWNVPLLQKAGLASLHMPRVETGMKPVGEWCGVPVYPDLGDQQVCALGAQLEENVCLHVNVGTAGLMGVLKRDFSIDGCESRPWITPGYYLRTVSGLMGGRHVAALNEKLGGDHPEVWQMMTQNPVPEAQSLYAQMAEGYRRAAETMQADVQRLCYSGGCVTKNPALRNAVASAFDLAENAKEVIGGVWEGMQALISMVEECNAAM